MERPKLGDKFMLERTFTYSFEYSTGTKYRHYTELRSYFVTDLDEDGAIILKHEEFDYFLNKHVRDKIVINHPMWDSMTNLR